MSTDIVFIDELPEHGLRDVSPPKNWTGRCFAEVKYIHGWRCTRFANGDDQLCSNHRRHGARVPTIWTNDWNEFGVNVPRGIGPYAWIKPSPGGAS